MKLLKFVFRLLAWLGIVWPIVVVYSRVIKKTKSEYIGDNRPVILFLSYERLQKDIQILDDTEEFCVLRIPFIWQKSILNQFYPKGTTRAQIFNPENSVNVAKAQNKLHVFMRRFLTSLYRKLGVKCVVSPGLYYHQDLDWGKISDELGFPFILIPRENYGAESANHERYKRLLRHRISFSGSRIICQSEPFRDLFIKHGIVDPEKIVALGCLRMDAFIENVKSYQKTLGKRKNVLLFSFSHGTSLIGHPDQALYFDNPHWTRKSDIGWVKLFESVHSAFARLAIERPDVDFIIKPKWLGRWKEEIEKAVAKRGINLSKISNIFFTEEEAHTLILDSDVVCSFGSNTIVEAGFASKPVIIPMYYEAKRKDYREYLWYYKYYNLYDIAESEESFIALVNKRLLDPTVEDGLLEKRKSLFEYAFSSQKSDATEKYITEIKDIINV